MKTRNVVKSRVLLPAVVVTMTVALWLSGQGTVVDLQETPGASGPAVLPTVFSLTDIVCTSDELQFVVAWPGGFVPVGSALDLYLYGTNSLAPKPWTLLGTRIDVPTGNGWDAFSLSRNDLPDYDIGWDKNGFFYVVAQVRASQTEQDNPFEYDPFEPDFKDLDGDGDGIIVVDNENAVWFNIDVGEKQDLTDSLFGEWSGSTFETLPFPVEIGGINLTGASIAPNGLVCLSKEWGAGWAGLRPDDLFTIHPAENGIPLVVAGFWGYLSRGEETSVSLAYVPTTDGAEYGVIEYKKMQVNDAIGTGTVSCQIVFKKNVPDRVVVLFKDVTGCGNGRSATLGVHLTATAPKQYSFNDGDAVRNFRMVTYLFD